MSSYDELGMFEDNAREAGLPWDGPPRVERVDVDGVSALVWGDRSEAPLVLLHGGAQNAHTWDTVALALDRPVVAIDLPGHGHSAWRDDHDYRPAVMAPTIARAVDELAPDAAAVVGMSLGGLTALALSATRPDLVRRLALVDITPGVNAEKAADVHAFVDGPEYFADFDEILTRTVQFNPSRSPTAGGAGATTASAPTPSTAPGSAWTRSGRHSAPSPRRCCCSGARARRWSTMPTWPSCGDCSPTRRSSSSRARATRSRVTGRSSWPPT